MLAREIHMRDPYVLVNGARYILIGTTDENCWRGTPSGFLAYESNDLQTFEAAGSIFTPPTGFWGTRNFWAPEMHAYRGAYYLFASFKSDDTCRGTSILRADNPLGPFLPHGARTVTPESWECLDGTLYVDGAGSPWLVFCHEWVQVGDGEICARKLLDDLSGPAGQPVKLFTASQAPWAKPIQHKSGIQGYVTDGPFLYKPQNGQLWMLWSSMSETGYAIGQAVSESGSILGPWRQRNAPLYAGDGGHGMVFRDLNGQLWLTIHTPNETPMERPIFLSIVETEDGFALA